MKVVVLCDCGNSIELVPTDNGQHAYVNNQFKNRFNIDRHNVDIETSLSASLEESFVSELTDANDYEEVIQILENDAIDNVSYDSELKSLRIDCNKCDDYIVLTNFD